MYRRQCLRFFTPLLLSGGLHASIIVCGTTPGSLLPDRPKQTVVLSVRFLPPPSGIVAVTSSKHQISERPRPHLKRASKSPPIVVPPISSDTLTDSSVMPEQLPPLMPLVEAREILPEDIRDSQLSGTGESNEGSIVAVEGYLDALLVDRRIRAHQDLAPVYPLTPYVARQPGRVVAEILVDEFGGVNAIRTVVATDGFEHSAIEALKSITFSPAERGGQKVRSRMIVEVEYKLIEFSSGITSGKVAATVQSPPVMTDP